MRISVRGFVWLARIIVLPGVGIAVPGTVLAIMTGMLFSRKSIFFSLAALVTCGALISWFIICEGLSEGRPWARLFGRVNGWLSFLICFHWIVRALQTAEVAGPGSKLFLAYAAASAVWSLYTVWWFTQWQPPGH